VTEPSPGVVFPPAEPPPPVVEEVPSTEVVVERLEEVPVPPELVEVPRLTVVQLLTWELTTEVMGGGTTGAPRGKERGPRRKLGSLIGNSREMGGRAIDCPELASRELRIVSPRRGVKRWSHWASR